MIKLPITKSVKPRLLVEQLSAAFLQYDADDWLHIEYVDQNAPTTSGKIPETHPIVQLYVYIPEGVSVPGVQAVIDAHDPTALSGEETTRKKLINVVQSTAGVAIKDLTTAQIKALIAFLIYRAGGLDLDTMTINPIDKWL